MAEDEAIAMMIEELERKLSLLRGTRARPTAPPAPRRTLEFGGVVPPVATRPLDSFVLPPNEPPRGQATVPAPDPFVAPGSELPSEPPPSAPPSVPPPPYSFIRLVRHERERPVEAPPATEGPSRSRGPHTSEEPSPGSYRIVSVPGADRRKRR
jgi:hypothetical protein